MSKGWGTALVLGTGTRIENDQIIFSYHTGIASWSPLVGTIGAMSDEYWIHVVATIDGADYKTGSLYINGILQESKQTWGPLYQNDLDLLIGAEPNYTEFDYGWNGMLDDIRIYDEHIDAASAMELFVNTYSEARPTIPEPGMVFLLGLGGLALIRRRKFAAGRS